MAFTVTFASYLKLSDMQVKKFCLIAFFVFLTGLIHAQFLKGDKMVGATLGAAFFNASNTEYTYPPPTTGFTRKDRSFGINLTPNCGWFVSENIAVGATFNLTYNHDKYFDEDAATGNTFNQDQTNNFNIGFGAFARDYFKSAGSLLPFGQVGFNFGMSSSTMKGFYFSGGNKSTYDGKSSGGFFANAGLAFGMTKMMSKTVGLDFSVGYNYSYKKADFKTTTLTDVGNNGTIDQTSINQPTQKYTNHGVVLGVGFQVFLERKK
jgi:hypothetical protein